MEGEALLQLRKACRILDGVRALRNIDRHHTLVVEGSFAALERTVQFYVVDREMAETADLMNHEDTFEYGMQAGVFSEATKDELVELWQNARQRPEARWTGTRLHLLTGRTDPIDQPLETSYRR